MVRVECAPLTMLQADKMEVLEKSQGWKEADFDQIVQYLRTILLRRTYNRIPAAST